MGRSVTGQRAVSPPVSSALDQGQPAAAAEAPQAAVPRPEVAPAPTTSPRAAEPAPASRRDPRKVFTALVAEERRLEQHIRAEIEAEVRPVILAKIARRRAVETELDELEHGTGRFCASPAGAAVRELSLGVLGAPQVDQTSGR